MYRKTLLLPLFILLTTLACHQPIDNGDGKTGILLAADAAELNPGNTKLTASWTMVGASRGYEVWYSTDTDSANAKKANGLVIQNDSIVSSEIKDLTNGVTYYVWTKTKYSTGTSGFSPVSEGAAPLPPPHEPGVIKVVEGSEFLDISWNTVPAARDYEAYYGTIDDPDRAVKWDGDIIAENGVVSLSINGLENDTVYYVRAKAINGAGESPFSRSVQGKPSAATAVPLAPASLAVEAKNKRLDLTWPSAAGASRYKIYYHTENSLTGRTELPAILHTPGTMNAAIRELTNDTVYYVWVYALNNMGDSASAATGSGSPRAKPPLDYTISSTVIGTTDDTIKGEYIIRLVCESAAWFAREYYSDVSPTGKIDFVFYNKGIINGTYSSPANAALQKGNITITDVKGVLPHYTDCLAIISMKGSDVIEMIRHGRSLGSTFIGIMSKEITSSGTTFFVDGAPLQLDGTYYIATSTFLVGGGDGYSVIRDNAAVLLRTDIPSWQPLAAYIYDQEDPVEAWY